MSRIDIGKFGLFLSVVMVPYFFLATFAAMNYCRQFGTPSRFSPVLRCLYVLILVISYCCPIGGLTVSAHFSGVVSILVLIAIQTCPAVVMGLAMALHVDAAECLRIRLKKEADLRNEPVKSAP